jgi:hypothetical protein
MPYKVVTLLRSAQSVMQAENALDVIFDPKARYDKTLLFYGDLRQGDEANSWLADVRDLMCAVRLIVLDTRDQTDQLDKEKLLIKELQFDYKTIRIIELVATVAPGPTDSALSQQLSMSEPEVLIAVPKFLSIVPPRIEKAHA